jgi:hypothetical protein
MMTHHQPCGGTNQPGRDLQLISVGPAGLPAAWPVRRRLSPGHWAGGRSGRERAAHGGDATQARAVRGCCHQGWSGANALD